MVSCKNTEATTTYSTPAHIYWKKLSNQPARFANPAYFQDSIDFERQHKQFPFCLNPENATIQSQLHPIRKPTRTALPLRADFIAALLMQPDKTVCSCLFCHSFITELIIDLFKYRPP